MQLVLLWMVSNRNQTKSTDPFENLQILQTVISQHIKNQNWIGIIGGNSVTTPNLPPMIGIPVL